jgi:hypothetical protein
VRRRRIGPFNTFLSAALVFVLLGTGSGTAAVRAPSGALRPPAAQETGADPRDLNITVDAEGFRLVETVTAGWYIVTLDNTTDDDVVADLVMLPEGKEVDDFQKSLNTESGGSTIPDWFEQVVFAGGPSALPGAKGQTLVELTPGTWTVLQIGQVGGKSAQLVVTEASVPATRPGLTAAVAITFEPGKVTMPGLVPAGQQVWSVDNTDTLTHSIALVLLPGEVSYDEMLTMLTTGTAPETIDKSKAQVVGGIGLLSGGRAVWTLFDLAPGYYVALDYTPLKDGRSFAELGQFAMFTVQ